MDRSNPKRPLSVYAVYLFVGLLFIVSTLVLIRVSLDIQRLHKSGTLPSRHGWRWYTPNSTPSTSFIESWMTFGYINQVFDLPTSYLQHQLSIVDPKYPNMQVGRYAKSRGIEVAAFVLQVRYAVNQYQLGMDNR